MTSAAFKELVVDLLGLPTNVTTLTLTLKVGHLPSMRYTYLRVLNGREVLVEVESFRDDENGWYRTSERVWDV